MWLPILGIIIGIVLGLVLPLQIPTNYASYMSIAVLAALDSVFGGIRASLEDNFQTDIFISGFFGNAFLAAGLAYIGDRLDVPIYLAAIFALDKTIPEFRSTTPSFSHILRKKFGNNLEK